MAGKTSSLPDQIWNVLSHLEQISVGTALLAVLTLWFVYTVFIKPFLSPLRKIPGRPYIPLLGNSREIARSEALTNTLRWMKDLNSTIVRFYLPFGRERLLVADPTSMKHILVTNSKNYERISPGLTFPLLRVCKGGLLVTTGEEHHAQRRLCNIAFRKAVLASMIPTFEKHAKKLVKFWLAKMSAVSGKTVEVPAQNDIIRLTLDIICETGFDFPLNSVENETDEEARNVSALLRSFRRDIKKSLPFYQYLPFEENRRFKKNKEMVDLLVKSVMKKKRTALHTSDKDNTRDLLTNLILARDETGAALEESEIQTQIITFLLAGHETTSTGLSWVLKQLSELPEVQERLRREVRNSCHDDDDLVMTADSLDKMPYLNCVIRETLRFLPPVTSIWRKSLKEDTLCGYKIPSGTTIGLHVGTMMRLPQFWDDPEVFKPERFLGDKTIDPYSFLPFGAGAHMCIGHRFAVLEMSTVLATFVRSLRFEPVVGMNYKRSSGITMKPSPPLVLKIEKI
ncbi:uncharacterized protein LOC135480257 [Liolophura sinensis]|uniref:uncharacterized protein LOC135480257 n=1 Tax=Liolophura sinensis TaxID=3198878 RepID=UPI003158370F